MCQLNSDVPDFPVGVASPPALWWCWQTALISSARACELLLLMPGRALMTIFSVFRLGVPLTVKDESQQRDFLLTWFLPNVPVSGSSTSPSSSGGSLR